MNTGDRRRSRNSKSESRNPKQMKKSKQQEENLGKTGLIGRLKFSWFRTSDLFRISDFVLRI